MTHQNLPVEGSEINVREGHGFSRARLIPVDDDTMEPTLRRGDAVFAGPCDRFVGDGLYVLDNGYPRIYRCHTDFQGNVILASDNKHYDSYTISMAAFSELVIGCVGALCTILDHRFVPQQIAGRA